MPPGSRSEAVDHALKSLRRQLNAVRRRESRPRTSSRTAVWSFARKVCLAIVAALLPFVVLLKISVWLYAEYHVSVWLSLTISAVVTASLLAVYTMFVSYWITGRFTMSAKTFRAAGVLVGIFCIYSLVYISAANVKAERIKDTYSSLHPLLRLSVSTLVLVDSDIVVTDLGRSVADYERMGLPPNERSLHLRQTTGYVHAIDLRTRERNELRNWLMAGYFRVLGFGTLRHVGTADHLHVSLPVAR